MRPDVPLPYRPSPEQARAELRTWTRNRRQLRQAAGEPLRGDWIPVAVEVLLDELDRTEPAGMVLTDLEEVPLETA